MRYSAWHRGGVGVEGPIFHLALAGDWGADRNTPYAVSTLGKSLAEVGFIIYGPINRDAVVKVTPLRLLDDGRLDVATAL